jgi:TolB-like protein/DNA-binding winged helix-turn-helix (wHTH) protein
MAQNAFEFDDYRLDCDRFELCRAGRSLKLERKPMELLILLAAKEGHLVTRTEIAERLWEREVFVDTEHGINTAIRKSRQALRDDPEQPRFVQTVTGKGYRFIGTIREVPSPAHFPGETASLPQPPSPAVVSPVGIPPAHAPPRLPGVPGEPRIASTSAAPRSSRRRIWFTGILAVTAIVLALLVFHSSGRSRRMPQAAVTSLAVLPLDNLSGTPGDDYLAAGLTDELTTMLAKESTLRVVSRTSAMQYKGAHRPLPEIARALGVDGVLEGSVIRTGDTVHMTIQLIQASTDTHLWAESYDRKARDVVTLPREAAQTIAKRLNVSADAQAPVRYVSPEAHDAYLRGRYLWYTDHTDKAGPYFKRATELQPDYAAGWAGLSLFYGASLVKGQLSPAEALGSQAATADKALSLDDTLPEAHLAAVGVAMVGRWDLAAADREAQRAIELDPKFAEAYHLRAKILGALNRNQEAIAAQKTSSELDPFTRVWGVAQAYMIARQYDAALADALQRLEADPSDPGLYHIISRVEHIKGLEADSAKALAKAYLLSNDAAAASEVQRAFDHGGRQELLAWRLARLRRLSASRYVSPVDLASLLVQLGRRDEAISQLEEALRQRAPGLLWIRSDPDFDPLLSNERYRLILRQVGISSAS